MAAGGSDPGPGNRVAPAAVLAGRRARGAARGKGVELDRLSQIALIVLGVVAAFAALSLLRPIAVPMALALVVGVVLSPLSDFWERRGFPPVLGALVGLAAALVVLFVLVVVFQPIVARLVLQAPKVWADMQDTVRSVQGLVLGLSEVADEVEAAVADPEPGAAAPPAEDAVELPTLADAVMAAPGILARILVFAGVLFFFLLTRREIYEAFARTLPDPGQRARMAAVLRGAERQVSHYFVTITLINAGLGAATAGWLRLLGMPDAILWGVLAFLFNFLLYLGPAIFVVVLLFAGVAAFDGRLAILPAAGFVLLNGIEGQFVTPALIGRALRLNPLMVFLALVFGVWLWGPVGGIVAIPVVLWGQVLVRGLVSADAAPPPRKAP